MKILIVEDDAVNGALLNIIMSKYGSCDIATDGRTAVTMFDSAMQQKKTYSLVCLDIMLPELDGQGVLREIRRIEKSNGIGGLDQVKVLMITALCDKKSIIEAFNGQCEGYIVKPIRKDKVISHLEKMGFSPKAVSGKNEDADIQSLETPDT